MGVLGFDFVFRPDFTTFSFMPMPTLARIVYFGSDAICLPGLRYLREAGQGLCELALIVSQPDRPQGRGKQLQPNPVAAYAREQGIELLQPEKPDAALAAHLMGAGLALGFVMAYGHFLPKALREAPRHGLLNFHGSLLPRYRGASPVETALAMGDAETGVCLMQVVREMDAGAVADCERVAIEPSDTGPLLRARVGEAVVPLLVRTLEPALEGRLSFQAQNVAQATFCRKLTKQDGALDFNESAARIEARLRAFTSWPGGYFEYRGTVIKVGSAEALPVSDGAAPGTVLAAGECFDVATASGVIRFHQLQRPGGRMLPAAAFLLGFPIALGTVLPSVTHPPLVSGRGVLNR